MTVPQPAMRKRLATMLMKAVNLALPPRCLGCGLIVEQDDSLCVACWSGLSFIRAPRCAACGVPFETDLGEVALCAPCMEERPTFDGARAAIVYAELPRKIMMRFKYGGRKRMRAEERRVGNERDIKCRPRWSKTNSQKTNKQHT